MVLARNASMEVKGITLPATIGFGIYNEKYLSNLKRLSYGFVKEKQGKLCL